MEDLTIYYLSGLDAGGTWRRVHMWGEDSRPIWPMRDTVRAIAEAVRFKENIGMTHWQDAMLERVVSTFIPIELDTEE